MICEDFAPVKKFLPLDDVSGRFNSHSLDQFMHVLTCVLTLCFIFSGGFPGGVRPLLHGLTQAS